VIIGGDHGTAGAIRMAGEAALRAGAGLVKVLTRSENIAPVLTARPELMVDALTPQTLEESLAWADVVVIGPGLGQQEWGKKALQKVENFRKPMLWDADALNLLAINPDKRHNRVITPHPVKPRDCWAVPLQKLKTIAYFVHNVW
jgi:NAD(P)H-hydrate epimerase